MKPIYPLIIIACIITACKKEINQADQDVTLQNLKTSLKDSMNAADYANLDFTGVVSNRVDSAGLYFLRVPFKGKLVDREFVLAKINKDGRLQEGKIIQLDGGVREVGGVPVKKREWEGSITISSLNRQSTIRSGIHRGYIDAFHIQTSARESVLKAADLPEVVVVAYVHNYDTNSFSTWLWLNSFFYTNSFDVGAYSGGYGGNYYGSLGSYGGSGGSGSYCISCGGGMGGTQDQTMLVDIDTYVDHPAIDINDYLKCFASISDQGATCSIEIFTDIPVDADPTKLFNWNTESPGHTFLQLKKTSADGTQSIVQNIGFYPQSNWKNILDANPVDSKLVDDGSHEFNASLRMNLNPNSFSSVLGKIKELSSMKYDMDEFNCTDFALEVFNYVRAPLQIPQYAIPGGIGTNSSNTPQGLYIKLKDMKKNADPEAINVSMPGVKGWVAKSNGPCY